MKTALCVGHPPSLKGGRCAEVALVAGEEIGASDGRAQVQRHARISERDAQPSGGTHVTEMSKVRHYLLQT